MNKQLAAPHIDISLFPLNAVLFPGGLLSLKVFDSRYLDLLTRCLQDKTSFGVIALKPREAHEKTPGRSQAFSSPSGGLAQSDRSGGSHTGTQAQNTDHPEHESQARPLAASAPPLEPIGVLAEPLDATSLQPGIMQVRCQGTQRFELGEMRQKPDGLWQARVSLIADDAPALPQETHLHAVRSLATVINQLKAKGQHPFLKPYPFNQAGWVANRWCEILPISVTAKQRLMELRDPLARLDLVGAYLKNQGVER